jgi:hypothetical protein
MHTLIVTGDQQSGTQQYHEVTHDAMLDLRACLDADTALACYAPGCEPSMVTGLVICSRLGSMVNGFIYPSGDCIAFSATVSGGRLRVQ